MSSPEASRGSAGRSGEGRRSAVLRVLGALALAGVLGACADGEGFRPLYGVTASGARLDERMAQVDIGPIPGRVGQQIRNELIFVTNAAAPADGPRPFLLEVAIRESTTSTLVKSSGESLSQVYALEAHFRLVSVKEKRIVLQGVSYGRAGFERFESIFSNVRAAQDAENRAARFVASDLKMRIAAHLSGAR